MAVLPPVSIGHSEEEAKHNAAKCIPKRLNKLGTSSPDPIPAEMMDVSDVISPYVGKLQENAADAL